MIQVRDIIQSFSHNVAEGGREGEGGFTIRDSRKNIQSKLKEIF